MTRFAFAGNGGTFGANGFAERVVSAFNKSATASVPNPHAEARSMSRRERTDSKLWQEHRMAKFVQIQSSNIRLRSVSFNDRDGDFITCDINPGNFLEHGEKHLIVGDFPTVIPAPLNQFIALG